MDHTYGHRPVVGPWFFDAEILEVFGQVRRAGRSQELGDGEFEGVGEFFQIIHADVHLASFDLADVRPMKPGQLGQDLLRPAAGEAEEAHFLGERQTGAGGDVLG